MLELRLPPSSLAVAANVTEGTRSLLAGAVSASSFSS